MALREDTQLDLTINIYRGISIAKEDSQRVIENINSKGLVGNEGSVAELVDSRSKLEALFNKEPLSFDDTRGNSVESYKATFACGDYVGASHYALVHNKPRLSGNEGYVIEFTKPLQQLNIDGRDFLTHCFQFWDRYSTSFQQVQSQALEKLFGPSILKYFQKALKSNNSIHRLVLCDLACQDNHVIFFHASNKSLIKGRYGTIFGSAFFVKLPVKPEEIISVKPAHECNYTPNIKYDDFFNGKL